MKYGIDEVGRGCWAGPLVVAAVSLGEDIQGLDDSKALSVQKRERLSRLIHKHSNNVIIEYMHSQDVDRYGLAKSMELAVHQLFSSISKQPYDTIVIDGSVNFLHEQPRTEAVIKADALDPNCMAASIVAKVARDAYMQQLAETHPAYGFESHVGYGTKRHSEAIKKYGLIDEHRRSFKPIKQFIEGDR